MTIGLYLITLLAGLVLGWQGHRLAAERRRDNQLRLGKNGEVAGPELDLTDHALFDWRADAPEIARCHVCHGKGRVWSIDGYGHRCPCGAPVTHHRTAAR